MFGMAVLAIILAVVAFLGFKKTRELKKLHVETEDLRQKALKLSKRPGTPLSIVTLPDGETWAYMNGKPIKIPPGEVCYLYMADPLATVWGLKVPPDTK